MNVKQYKVAMEIEGPMGLFTRPDTGTMSCSYPIPTWSQAKGIFEAVCKVDSALINPIAVEICKPVQYREYTTNYRGPLRKKALIDGNNAMQVKCTILEDPCFRLYGVVEKLKDNVEVTTNPEHALQCMFNRYLKEQHSRYHPCLGLKEFHSTYFGPIREDTANRYVQQHCEIIPSMLYSVFDKKRDGVIKPFYKQNAQIINGRLVYDK